MLHTLTHGGTMAALLLGLSSGLRTFTAPAVLFLFLHNRVAGIVLAILALGEYVLDQLPTTPSRTTPGPLAARVVSGAIVGWFSTPTHAIGLVIAIIGAVIGAFGGVKVRLWTMKQIGPVPAGLIEDLIAIGIAVGGVSLIGH
jgi:uncharacterized membrane protein